MQVFLWWVCFGVACCVAPNRTVRSGEDNPAPVSTIAAMQKEYCQVSSFLYRPDTIIYHNNSKKMRRLVNRFSLPGRKHYDKVFAEIIDSLNASRDFFNYIFEKRGEKGRLYYHGTTMDIYIIAPSKRFGTGAEGILFEETWHLKQFLDGETYFKCVDTAWRPYNNLWQEVDAKMFAVNHLKVTEVYAENLDSGSVKVFTELGYMKSHLTNNRERADYLKYGGDPKTIIVRPDHSIALPHTQPLYPELQYDTFPNRLKAREKNDSVFGYPRRKPAKIPF